MPVPARRPILIIMIALLLLVIGTVGYWIIEGWTLLDAFYMTVITLSTVGFGETHPLSETGRLFTSLLVIASVVLIVYGVEFIVSARQGGQYFRRRQMMRHISKMRNHVIVCGYGRVGQSAVTSLIDGSREIVVIELDPEQATTLENRGLPYVIGDATQDDILQQAGVQNARGLIVSMGNDSLNSFVVLSARALNEGLHIVVRSVDANNERKMLLAGANRVVSPYQIGGKHMANIMVRPQVTDFFDVVTLDDGVELWVEELMIDADSSLVGKTVGEADIRRQTGVTVVAVYSRAEGRTLMPRASTILGAGDEMIVLGTRQQLAAMQRLTEQKHGRTRPTS